MSVMDWPTMGILLRSPALDERQIDNWSCGLFVMIAIQSFVDGWKDPLLGVSAREDVRAGALRALRNVPSVFYFVLVERTGPQYSLTMKL